MDLHFIEEDCQLDGLSAALLDATEKLQQIQNRIHDFDQRVASLDSRWSLTMGNDEWWYAAVAIGAFLLCLWLTGRILLHIMRWLPLRQSSEKSTFSASVLGVVLPSSHASRMRSKIAVVLIGRLGLFLVYTGLHILIATHWVPAGADGNTVSSGWSSRDLLSVLWGWSGLQGLTSSARDLITVFALSYLDAFLVSLLFAERTAADDEISTVALREATLRAMVEQCRLQHMTPHEVRELIWRVYGHQGVLDLAQCLPSPAALLQSAIHYGGEPVAAAAIAAGPAPR